MKGLFRLGILAGLLFLLIQVSPVPAQVKDEVLARVGNDVITRVDFETRIKSLPPAAREMLKNPNNKKHLLDNMVKARLLVVESGKRGLSEQPDVLAKVRMFRDDVLTQEYVRAYLEKKVEVTDQDAENYYNMNPDIRERESFKVSQIVVEKEEEAKEILEKLKKGEYFKKMVKERSVDPASKYTGGELEWFEKGKGPKEFEEALLNVEKGGVTDVVKANGKYYILKLDEKMTVPKPPFLKVKDQIIKKLMEQKVAALVEKEIEELKKQIAVETFYDKLSPEGK